MESDHSPLKDRRKPPVTGFGDGVLAVLSTLPDSVVITDGYGHLESFNPAAMRMFGHSRQLMEVSHINDLLPGVWESRAEFEVGVSFESTGLRHGGEQFPVEVEFGDITREQAPLHIFVLRDISERKEFERALNESAARVRAIIETVPDGIVTIDSGGYIQSFNPAAERMFGYTAGEVVGRKVNMLMPDPYRSAHDEFIRAYLETGQARIIGTGREVVALKKNGDVFPIDLAIGEIRTGGGRVFAGIIRDVSERKQTEASLLVAHDSLARQIDTTNRAMSQLQDATAKLVQNEQMAALGRLVAGISHEINTPLGIGVTAASFLADNLERIKKEVDQGTLSRTELDEFLTHGGESAEVILKNLRRASELMESFKHVAVDQASGAARKFRLAAYVDEIVLSLLPVLKRSPHQLVNACPTDIELISFPGAISQILTNFVMNSLNHAYADRKEPGTMTIDAQASDDQVSLIYSDDGCGMSAAVCERIFEPYFTTRREDGGSGLGLHLVYNLVHDTLGGQLKVESTPDEGTTFTVRIPRKPVDSDE